MKRLDIFLRLPLSWSININIVGPPRSPTDDVLEEGGEEDDFGSEDQKEGSP